MMREDQLLQQAISAARAGRELTARDIFLEIVEINPRSEVAWMWLTGLLDDLDDCIYACKMVLEINPGNVHAREYLGQLRVREQKRTADVQKHAEGQIRQAQNQLAAGQRGAALALIRNVTQSYESNAEAWRLFAELSSEPDERIRAFEKYLALLPSDVKARDELNRLRHFKDNPLELASIYEEQGDFEKAIKTYEVALLNIKSNKEWNAIYRKRARLENLLQEKIAHISPAISVSRLAGGPSLLYLSLLFVHIGLNPIANPDPLLFVGFLWTVLGGGMIAFASVRSHHRLWFLLFKDVGSSGSPVARFAMAAAGWILVLLPYVLLFTKAFDRLFEWF
jgi:tetratricopeptide (TPR) repeat protein